VRSPQSKERTARHDQAVSSVPLPFGGYRVIPTASSGQIATDERRNHRKSLLRSRLSRPSSLRLKLVRSRVTVNARPFSLIGAYTTTRSRH
jgi:hypothetical protein